MDYKYRNDRKEGHIADIVPHHLECNNYTENSEMLTLFAEGSVDDIDRLIKVIEGGLPIGFGARVEDSGDECAIKFQGCVCVKEKWLPQLRSTYPKLTIRIM